MEAQKDTLSADTLAAIQWLGMPEGTPFPLERKQEEHSPLIVGHNSESAGAPVPTEEISEHDPRDWVEDFQRWIVQSCISRPGRDDWSSIGCLWVDFCEWTNTNDSVSCQHRVPCQRRVFEQLLVESGLRLHRGMVGGLLLMRDLEGYEAYENGGQAG